RLRDPGQTHKANIESETEAAAAAGITTLCNPPDTAPVIDTTAVAELIAEKAELAGKAAVLPIGALTRGLDGHELSAMFALRQSGCIAFGNASRPITNTLVLRRAMEYAATHDFLVIVRPDDPWLSNRGCAHEGRIATRYGLPGIPETAETVAIAQSLALAEQAGCRVHFGQLSCARSIELLAEAKNRGLPVSADAAVHQLVFTEEDIPPFDSHYHVIPPFRGNRDLRALIEGLSSGVLDAVCSDHQPHDIDAKLGAFPSTEPGVSSLQTLLPLILSLVEDGAISLSQGIAALTVNPARILKLESGALKPGAKADLCIFDPAARWKIDEHSWKSLGRNTPFWGKEMTGRITCTVHNGKIVYSL
ncbi:MAG: dihydroorotase, partial [Gammaproteobacteria bacterium]